MREKKKFLGASCILVFIGIVFSYLYYRDNLNDNEEINNDKIFLEEDLKGKEELKDKIDKESNEIISVEEENIEELNLKEKEIKVHIDGEIKNPGVYSLKEESILDDLVKIAGGLTEKADMNEVNLAELLENNKKITIPKVLTEEEKKKLIVLEENKENEKIEEKGKNNNGKININEATVSELDEIPGVGPSTAEKIISYREKNGKFKTLEELKEVDRIGDKTFEKIKEFICI